MSRSRFKLTEGGDNFEVGNDEDVGHGQESTGTLDVIQNEATNTAYSPELDHTLPSTEIDSPCLDIPRQQQPTFAHDPLSSEMLLDKSALQSAPVPDQKASKRGTKSDETDGRLLKRAKNWIIKHVSGGSSSKSGV
jgi:hypothetical protein